MWSSISLEFWFEFPWWIMMFSIISCTYWPYICLRSRNTYLNSYPILKLGCLLIAELQKTFIYPGYCSNYHIIALISHASKVMLKILQARLQQYMNHELPDVQDGFTKGRGTRDQIVNIHWIIEKAREFQKKYLLLLYWLCQSLWLCVSQQTVENS